jgi:hypothetical protein
LALEVIFRNQSFGGCFLPYFGLKCTLEQPQKGKEGNMRRQVSPDVLQATAEAAYYIAEQQGFAPGHELENWLKAERQVLGQRLNAPGGHPNGKGSPKKGALLKSKATTSRPTSRTAPRKTPKTSREGR